MTDTPAHLKVHTSASLPSSPRGSPRREFNTVGFPPTPTRSELSPIVGKRKIELSNRIVDALNELTREPDDVTADLGEGLQDPSFYDAVDVRKCS